MASIFNLRNTAKSYAADINYAIFIATCIQKQFNICTHYTVNINLDTYTHTHTLIKCNYLHAN